MAHRLKVLPKQTIKKKKYNRNVPSVNKMEHTAPYLQMTSTGKHEDLFSRRKYHMRKHWWKTGASKFLVHFCNDSFLCL